MKAVLTAVLSIATLFCAGCASVTQGTTHNLRIETITERGQQLDGADCTLQNDQGTTVAKSGASTLARRSSKDLEITCTASGQPDAKGRLVSRANVGLAGNVIIGGAIGAVIDHNTGAAYTYPSWVRLVFGQFNVYDRRDEREGTALAPTGAPMQLGEPVRVQVAAAPPPQRVAVQKGDTFDYRLTDRHTGRQQTIVLRAERVQAGEVSFNSGARIESPRGSVRVTSALVGELDQVTPPEGWLPGGRAPAGSWKMAHPSIVPGSPMLYDLDASVEGEQKIVVGDREMRTLRIGLRGWASIQSSFSVVRARYEGVAWVSPELGRVVRFEARSRTAANTASAAFSIDELAELVQIGRD